MAGTFRFDLWPPITPERWTASFLADPAVPLSLRRPDPANALLMAPSIPGLAENLPTGGRKDARA